MNVCYRSLQEYLENTKKHIEAQAIQNNLMRKELLLHEKARTDLTRDIFELKNSIAAAKSLRRRKKLHEKLALYIDDQYITVYYIMNCIHCVMDVCCVYVALSFLDVCQKLT